MPWMSRSRTTWAGSTGRYPQFKIFSHVRDHGFMIVSAGICTDKRLGRRKDKRLISRLRRQRSRRLLG